MANYIIVCIAVVGLAIQFCVNKYYQINYGASLLSVSRFTALYAALTAVVFLCINGFRLNVTPFSFWMALGISGLSCIYSLFGFKIISMGSVAIYTMFLMLGGMLLPYLYGVIFLKEPISVYRLIGVALLIAAMAIQAVTFGGLEKPDKKKNSILYAVLCAAVFFMNGFVSIFSKMQQSQTLYATVSLYDFMILVNLSSLIFSGFIYITALIINKKAIRSENSPPAKLWHLLFITLASTFFGGGSYLLQLYGASRLPATVLYPLITGGSIVLTALASFAFFRDKPDKKGAFGIGLAFAATLLFLF